MSSERTDTPGSSSSAAARRGEVVLPLKQESLASMTLIPGADLAISRLLDAGFVCSVVTVQSRIEKGRSAHPCPCGKPSPFLYERAASDHGLDLSRSYVIGDSPEDVEAARRFGGIGCLVRTGWTIEGRPPASTAFVGDTIVDGVDWILSREGAPAFKPQRRPHSKPG